ncbi:MAG: hypothetical protein DRQ02_12655 [Candidatus Latescibacterota bacterium]|nr:MAG: hypothetical protein DRQ02_12655 [Candidatus Latescibacterota bacterium]
MSGDAVYICQRCGKEWELPDGLSSILTRECDCCDNGQRATILIKKGAISPIDAFFDPDTGKFIPKKLAEEIQQQHHFITFEDTGEIYHYDGGIYHNNGEAVIRSICERILRKEASIHRVNEVVDHIRRSTYMDRSQISDSVDLLCVGNGILNLSTKELQPHTPKKIFLNKIPVDYNPAADCPRIKQFFNEVCYEEDIPTLQELFGYCLYRSYPIHKAAMFLGEGSNGKSVTINLLRKFLGHENVSSKELRELINDRFAVVELYGRLANVCADISPDALKRTGIFKALTGGDLITGARKFKGSFSFVNYAKLIFSANKLPMSPDKSYAFYRRWILISFPNTFEGENRNPNILEEISTPEELSGLLNWALEGLDRLLKNGDFSYSKTVNEIAEQYEQLSDPIYAYVNEFLKVELDGAIAKDELYEHYVKWCRERKLPVTAKNMLTRELAKHLPELRPGYIGGKGNQRPAYRNIAWKEMDNNEGNDEQAQQARFKDGMGGW